VEEGKKNFAGVELPQHVLGVVGLGKVGSLVADAAIKLGMEVFGYDPEITVDAAWSLPSQVRKAHSIEEVLRKQRLRDLHVPLIDGTRNLIDAKRIGLMKPGTVCSIFTRRNRGQCRSARCAGCKKTQGLCLRFSQRPLQGTSSGSGDAAPGPSTQEAEENCAIMVVDQVRDYLENGNIRNAVNFPDVVMPRESRTGSVSPTPMCRTWSGRCRPPWRRPA
jgi:D-3-phosphoglycerate dehydrogenase